MSKDAEYFKYTGMSAGFTGAGRPLAPGQIVRLSGEDGSDSDDNKAMIAEGRLVEVPEGTLDEQHDAILDAIDRPTKRGERLRERRDEAVSEETH